MSTPASQVSQQIQLIPTSISSAFPDSTSSGNTSAPATGTNTSLVPTAGSTSPSTSPNTLIPGTTTPTSTNGNKGIQLVTPNSSTTPANTSVAPSAPPAPTGSGANSGYSIPGATTVPANQNTTISPVNSDELVANQMNTLLSSGSPYLQLAANQSLQAASARGLQNSSIAAGAGQAAAIAAAEPIAAADAQTNVTTTQANQAALNQSSLQQQQGAINYALQAQTEQANINQILTQGVVNSNLSEQQTQEQIQTIKAQSSATIAQIDAQAAANASQDGPALQAQYLTGITNIMTSTNAQIQAIYSTQGLSAAQQTAAVTKAQQEMQQQISNLSAYYASSPLWDTGQTGANPGTPGP